MAKSQKRTPKAAKGASEVAPRVPRAISSLVRDDGGHARPVFSFALVDDSQGEKWGWHHLDEKSAKRLFDALLDLCKLTWTEIRARTGPGNHQQHRIHHDQDISTLCSSAQKRLASARYAELGGEIFRFKIDTYERLWGFEFSGMFFAVWWDRDHEVYPVETN